MKHRFLGAAVLAAVLVVLSPLAARAALYLNPKSGLAWNGSADTPPHPCTLHGAQVQCAGDRGIVYFKLPHSHATDCTVHAKWVEHSGSRTTRWQAVASGKCSLHWVKSNVIDVVPKP